jgi:hypothetical protein
VLKHGVTFVGLPKPVRDVAEYGKYAGLVLSNSLQSHRMNGSQVVLFQEEGVPLHDEHTAQLHHEQNQVEVFSDLEDASVDVMLETRGRFRGDVGNANLRDLYMEAMRRIKPGGSLYVLNPFPEEASDSGYFGKDAVIALAYELKMMENGITVTWSLTNPEPDALPVLQMQREIEES